MIIMSVFATSCSENGNGNLPEIERVPIPVITLVDNSDILIQDPATFKGKFTIDMLFKDDTGPKQFDIVVTRNGDYKNLQIIQAGVTSFPTNIEVDATKLASLFGLTLDDVVPGDYFEIGATVVTQSGLTIPAFSDLSNQFSADIVNFPGSSLSIKYPVVCPLDLDDFVGTFTIDDPDVFEGTYPVEITREGENVLVVTGFLGEPDSFIKLTINPKTTGVDVPHQVFTPELFGYNNGAVEGGGEIVACDKTITLNLEYTVDEGSFGTFGLTISK